MEDTPDNGTGISAARVEGGDVSEDDDTTIGVRRVTSVRGGGADMPQEDSLVAGMPTPEHVEEMSTAPAAATEGDNAPDNDTESRRARRSLVDSTETLAATAAPHRRCDERWRGKNP